MTSETSLNSEENSFSKQSLASEEDRREYFAIAGIGASAGGLEAFTQILRNLPTDTGMGFVLIQHLAPLHDSQLSNILQRATDMPVHEAREGMRIEPNSVYVIPPNTLMTIDQGILKLKPRQQVRGKYMVIDGFFSSLAADRGNKAIAIVLSGSNEDGTAGLGVIKSVGGITFAQDLASAEFPTMPMIAIASGYVDFVLSPAEIVTELVNISQHQSEETCLDLADGDDLDKSEDGITSIFADQEENLKQMFMLLHRAMGVDFSHYKQGTVRRRISRRMSLLNMQKLDEYAEYLQKNPQEVEKLHHDMLINVTSFFREPESFGILQQLVFPEICQHKPSGLPIRIWVAGCSTGEEAYSIAISLLEFFDDQSVRRPIQIFATDISEPSIARARSGIYSQNELNNVSPERLRRFFSPVLGGYQIGKLVRDLCVFARQNLTSDPPFSRLDLISCRNMLIYLEPLLQRKIMPIFHYALNPDGFLMLGSSEGIGNATDLFNIADKKNRIYQRKLTPPRMNFNFVKSTYVPESVNLEQRSEIVDDVNLEQLADQVVLNRYAPVGVTVNFDLEILKFRGQTSPFLEPPLGKASLNLLKMARLELRLELRSAIHSAKQQDIPICKDGIEMSGLLVKIDVIPLRINSDRFFLVLFESRPNPALSKDTFANASTKSRKMRQTEAEIEVVRLAYELENTKEYLRSIIDAQEVTNQDLKVASEEFLSSNEELQSANEELETAKEEIQATNEELSTINDELRNRNGQLHSVNNDLQNLLTSVNIPILMLSGDLRIRRFTPMAEPIFNLIASDVGRPFSDIHTNIDLLHLSDLITSVIDTLIPYEQDVQTRSGNWHSLRIRPYRTTDDRIDGVVIGLIDIDLLKRNAIALESSRNYANAIIETLRQPLIVLNFELRVITANYAFYETFHTNSSQTEQQSIFELGNKDWDTPKMRSLLNEILLMDILVHDYEVTQNFAQIGTRTMLLNACQIEQSGIGKMILIAIEDITERTQQKQQLIAKNKELSEAIAIAESASLAKITFLGNMSHELRTPLNAIMGFAQILQYSSNLDPELQQYTDIIYQSGNYLLSLIEDLLDISRIEAHKIEIEPNLLSLANFLQITVDMLSTQVANKNLTLVTQFAPDLPANISADEKRLRQVLLNLLGNAIKFTAAGKIIFAVNKIPSTNQSPHDLIHFTIGDTGEGIAVSELERIFLPFEQVTNSKNPTQGAGLGLAISQNLVKQMGGEITVTSAIGVGSTFSFALDLEPV